jgi:hypothetical protein
LLPRTALRYFAAMNALLTALLIASAPAAPAAQTSCDSAKSAAKDECDHPKNAPAAAATSEEALLLRGEKLKGLPKVELAALLKDPVGQDGKSVSVEGKVRKACSKKGCWMELGGDDKGPGVRVTFKDYGFFVPLDSAGRTAKVEGVVSVKQLTDELAKHYEGEGATVPRGKDGKPREVQLVASGVELRK